MTDTKAVIKCPKCGSEMAKTGMIDSGNTRFNVFKCKKCGNEKMVAIGSR